MAKQQLRNSASSEKSNVLGRRELIVAIRNSARAATASATAISGSGISRSVMEILKGKSIFPLFSFPPNDRLPTTEISIPRSFGASENSDAEIFHAVSAPDDQLDDLAERLAKLDEVTAAYVKPAAEPAILNTMLPSNDEPPSVTPDFSGRQNYLDAAPAGIDARFAWRFNGGRGSGVRIIDCEWGWRFSHEDLQSNKGGVVIGTSDPDDNHGTAVLGEFSGDQNGFGIDGICSEAMVSAAAFGSSNTATIIASAAAKLSAGDILLLEIHRPGPDASGAGQDGYIPIEWWPDDLTAIRFAINRGIIVVEAGGNGARNLDAAIFDTAANGFPDTWKNPFNPINPSSGAIVVGAGAPPPGTHGRDYGPNCSRLDFSNYGRRIDAQGWGREVTTTGYGDLQGGSNRDLWYTDSFSGTSSASPIIVGTIGCLQGILRARGLPLLTPARAQQLLRTTGTPQQDAPGRPRTQRIGNRPDLKQLIATAVGPSVVPDSAIANQPTSQSKVTIRIGDVTVTIESNGQGLSNTSG